MPRILKEVESAVLNVYDGMITSLSAMPVVRKGIVDRVAVEGSRRVDAEAVSREGPLAAPVSSLTRIKSKRI